MIKTEVVNIRKEPYDVYIGRAGHGQEGQFGNPYKDGTREENIKNYKIYFYNKIKNDIFFRNSILALRGKKLGCFCKEKACHGDIIADYLNSLPKISMAVIGSRSFNNYEYLKNHLQFFDISLIISGGARGADSLARQYAMENGIPIKEFIPQWEIYGKSAGYIRNKEIVLHADEVIAFWDGKSKGTQHSINIANEMGKPVTVCNFSLDTFDLDISKLGIS